MSKEIYYGKRKQRGGLQESLDTSVYITEEEFRNLISSDGNKYNYYCFDDRCNQILFLDTEAEDYQWLFIQLPLESIDNTNPSEALECVEDLIFNFSVDEYVDRYDNNLQVIKQALLKAQEPKQYLKWEDLEFTRDEKVMTVKMGNTTYKMVYYKIFGCFVKLYLNNEEMPITLVDRKQFFNDLHLERVE